MKVRIISGIIVGICVVGILALGPKALGVTIFVASILGLYEFYHAMENVGYTPMKLLGMMFTLAIPVITFSDKLSQPMEIRIDGIEMNFFSVGQLLMMLLIFLTVILRNKKYNIADGAITLFGGYYVVFFLSFLMLLRRLDYGLILVILAIIGTVATDTMAFQIGIKYGKKKLIPSISPKKTIVGSVGGFAGAVVIVFIYGFILTITKLYIIPLYHYCILGFIIAAASEVGDLAASAIKRYAGIKDFGKIMPGHGGILDRIDSLIFTAPVVYYYIQFFVNR